MGNATAEQLNAILADVWSLVRLLRKLESKTEHPGTKEALKRVRVDFSAHCASLSGLIRNFGAGPVDKPGELARKIGSMDDEPELWELLTRTISSAHERLGSLQPPLENGPLRDHVKAIAHNLSENLLWIERIVPRV